MTLFNPVFNCRRLKVVKRLRSYCVSGGQLASITLSSCVTDTCGGISSTPATSYKCLLRKQLRRIPVCNPLKRRKSHRLKTQADEGLTPADEAGLALCRLVAFFLWVRHLGSVSVAAAEKRRRPRSNSQADRILTGGAVRAEGGLKRERAESRALQDVGSAVHNRPMVGWGSHVTLVGLHLRLDPPYI